MFIGIPFAHGNEFRLGTTKNWTLSGYGPRFFYVHHISSHSYHVTVIDHLPLRIARARRVNVQLLESENFDLDSISRHRDSSDPTLFRVQVGTISHCPRDCKIYSDRRLSSRSCHGSSLAKYQQDE
jgi:hypothetical protein